MLAFGFRFDDTLHHYWAMLLVSLQCPDAKPSNVMELGSGPIRNISQHHDTLYVSCGPEVVSIRTPQLTAESRWRVIDE